MIMRKSIHLLILKKATSRFFNTSNDIVRLICSHSDISVNDDKIKLQSNGLTIEVRYKIDRYKIDSTNDTSFEFQLLYDEIRGQELML